MKNMKNITGMKMTGVKVAKKEALECLLDRIEKGPRESEEVAIVSAIGRVLSEDLAAVADDPPYSKSTVSGYLLLASGTALASFKRPMTFDLVGDIPDPSMAIELPLGKTVKVEIDSYMAIKRFMEGHYAVLKETEVERSDEVIHVIRRVEKHENIILQGSVRKVGNIIFRKRRTLNASDILVLAHQGILKVKVSRPPKVAVFSTGKELIAPGTTYKIGSKYDCNASCLSAMISKSGGLPLFYGIMPNDLLPFIKKIVEVVGKVDMVVLSGATRALGGYFMSDLIKGVSAYQMTNPVATLEAHRQAIISESFNIKPTLLGVIAMKPVICLSGEPEDIVDGFEAFVAPVLSHLLGEI